VPAGAGLGITATVGNRSEQRIYLRERDLVLTIPLELEGPSQSQFGYYSFFPTEVDDDSNSVISLDPGDKYTVIFTFIPVSNRLASNPALAIINRLKDDFYYLFFEPGDYQIVVNAKYWTQDKWVEDDICKDCYRTETIGVDLSVKTPQFVILFGAMVGGISAFILGTAQGKFQQRPIRFFLGLLGALILSGISTILLYRVSDSRFIVTISVNDFWGAIAVGFVAEYAGISFLENIIGNEGSEKNK
jgi:hypothetical protein